MTSTPLLDDLKRETLKWFIHPTALNVEERTVSYGGYSDVHRGTLQRNNGNDALVVVAIKQLKGTDEGELDDRFNPLMNLFREVLPWARLPSQAHIMPFLGYSFDGVGASLISPWYGNGNVVNYLKLHPDIDRKPLIVEAALGVEHLHSQKIPIIHADFKAKNVMIDDEGHVRIGDFGLAQYSAVDPSGLSTTVHDLRGTFRWISPEVFTGGPHSTQSDVWAFGCYIGEVLTGDVPLSGLPKFPFVQVLLKEDYKSKMLFPQIGEDHPVQFLLGVCCAQQSSSRWRIKAVRKKAESMPSVQYNAVKSPPNDTVLSVNPSYIGNSPEEVANEAAPFLMEGHLKIGERIQAGDLFDTHRGEWTPPHLKKPQQVAVEKLRGDINMTKRFLGQVRDFRNLHHPNVLPFLGIICSPQVCLIAPWCTGGDITEYLERHLDADKLLFVYHIANGLDYLHLQDVVHGNLKPSNILVNSQDEAVVSDFRLSSLDEARRSGQTLSSFQEFRDYRYLSPEVASGQGDKPASDVYSFAMVAIEILSGIAPHKEYTKQGRIRDEVVNGRMPLKDAHPSVDDSLWDLLSPCWCQEAGKRPNFTQIRSALRKACLTQRSPFWSSLVEGMLPEGGPPPAAGGGSFPGGSGRSDAHASPDHGIEPDVTPHGLEHEPNGLGLVVSDFLFTLSPPVSGAGTDNLDLSHRLVDALSILADLPPSSTIASSVGDSPVSDLPPIIQAAVKPAQNNSNRDIHATPPTPTSSLAIAHHARRRSISPDYLSRRGHPLP
ncbi:hypothetical protein FRB95_005672 [Tulasnella sp. JGI-2019a]|nr:hypothetical protein FRB95_005672 [Tulasnella sp. JGI-2019a]